MGPASDAATASPARLMQIAALRRRRVIFLMGALEFSRTLWQRTLAMSMREKTSLFAWSLWGEVANGRALAVKDQPTASAFLWGTMSTGVGFAAVQSASLKDVMPNIQNPVLGFLILLSFIMALTLRAQSSSDAPAYLDPKQPIEVRVNDLLGRMTLKEKVGQLNLPCVYVDQLGKTIPEKINACRRFAAGTYTNEIGPGCGFFTLADTILHEGARQQAEYFNELQKIAVTQTRLKIPLLQDEEGTHGAMFPGATVFPEGLAIGSTFDMPLVKSIYAAAAQEARAVGIHALSTLVLELDRDPRMGRNEEAYTEDPYLYSRIAERIVGGAQGTDIAAPDKVIALMTDFPTQSEPVSGLERGAIELSERSLRENFLPPWSAAITKSGALGVMAGYPEIEDVPSHGSEKWLNHVLREELGFKGIVVSEGGGFETLIYEHIVPTQKEAGALALRAGVDLDITYEPAYMGPLSESVQEGRVPIELVDRAVRRVLALKFQLGLFEHPYVDVDRAVKTMHSAEHQELALQAAREGIVLLKNEKNLLPLKKDLHSIAVIGPNADNGLNQLGDYSPHIVPQHLTTVLEGIQKVVSSATRVIYAKGCEVIGGGKEGFAKAVEAAKQADVAVVVLGEHPRDGDHGVQPTDGEGYDVASLDLTGEQEDLVEALVQTGKPIVVVLINGRPLSVRWIAEHVPAIVEAWEPGERGGEAVARMLFGDDNPSGRLAITIPRSVGQLPVYYNYKPSKAYWLSRSWTEVRGYADMPGTPLYPFGYGLSYTEFNESNLRIEPERIYPGGNAKVSVDVQNVGKRAGIETIQLYIHERFAPVSTPVKQLRGFERVALAASEKKTVTFTLGPADLQLLDRDMHWEVMPGIFDVMIGKSAADVVLQGSFDVKPNGPESASVGKK
jgi:beta-glucosidase